MVLCIDIGGTAIKHGLAVPSEGGIRFTQEGAFPTCAKELGGAGIEARILRLVSEQRALCALSGVAVSTAGMVDAETGAILYANENIPGYTGRNLKLAIEQAQGLPCAVENDVNAAALGEYAYGAGSGAQSLLCLTVGTGIGGAILQNGEIYRGHAGSAGEIGYMRVQGGEFQQLASASALVARVHARTGELLDGRTVLARAIQGDAVCTQETTFLCDVLAQGIANCLCLLNPQRVVLGGGIMAQETYLRPIIEAALANYTNPYILRHTALEFARLGNAAGMAGAYYVLRHCRA